jgi:putative phage-type endonuclease
MENREEWLAKRRKGIGGSDIPAIMGIDPFRTPLDVYLEKRGLVVQPETDAMRWGKLLEPIIASEYERLEGVKLIEPTESPYAHPLVPHHLASPDRFIEGRLEGWEAKATTVWDGWGENGSDEVPERVAVQCAWYMRVFNFDTWRVSGLLSRSEHRRYCLHRNQHLEDRLVDVVDKFWTNHVQLEEPPIAQASDGRALALLYPEPDNRIISIDPDDSINADIAELLDINEQIKELEQTKKTIQAEIKQGIGEAKGMAGVGWKAQWLKIKGGTYTREASRQLRVSRVKEG